MTKKVFLIPLALLLAISLVAIGCPAPGPAEPIKIGALLTYTGAGAPYGEWFENGLNLKLDEVGGEVAGRPIELIIEDDAFAPTTGVEKARKLIEHDQVDAIIGGLNGAVVIGVAEYTKDSRTPFAPFVDNSVECLYTGGNNVVMPWGTLRGGTYIVGQYAYDVLGFRTATTLRTDFVAGDQFMEGWETAFTERGGTIIQRQATPLGTMDYAPFVTALEEADCVAIWFTENAPFVRQYYEFGYDMPIVMASQGGMTADEMMVMGDDAIGIVTGAHEWLDDPAPATRQFVDGYTAKYGALPTQPRYTVSAYVVLTLLLEAIEATGGDTSPEKLNEAWKKVEVETATGVISFDEQGFGIGDFHIIEWVKEDGTYYWKMVKLYEQIVKKATGE